MAGNPTILIPFFVNGPSLIHTTPLGDELRALTPQVISMHAGRRFLGYLDGQVERLLGGGKRNKVPNRPELVARYGYDTKYASHALRLGRQGLELVTTGSLTLPMRPIDLEQCLAVKRGEVGFDRALDLIRSTRSELSDALDRGVSPLPADPGLDAVSEWMVAAHRTHWADRAL